MHAQSGGEWRVPLKASCGKVDDFLEMKLQAQAMTLYGRHLGESQKRTFESQGFGRGGDLPQRARQFGCDMLSHCLTFELLNEISQSLR